MEILHSNYSLALFREFLNFERIRYEPVFIADGRISSYKYFSSKESSVEKTTTGPNWDLLGPALYSYKMSVINIKETSDWTAQIPGEDLFCEESLFDAIMKSVINHHKKLSEDQ